MNSLLSSTDHDDHDQVDAGYRTTNKRHGARNQHRHKFFVRWLLKTFPQQLATSQQQRHLPEDSSNSTEHHEHQLHVLDIAGGKGELSARLCLCHGQNVVMVDPREANIENCYENLVLSRLPNKWQQSIQEKRAVDPNFTRDLISNRFMQLATSFDERSLLTNQELQNAVQNASLLIGLHADGATEAIVDVALRYNKPFVVVPCCVFPRMFPDRRVCENGSLVPVRTHEQFCNYLAQKDSRLQVETLPFKGRNTAIWWDGVDNLASNR